MLRLWKTGQCSTCQLVPVIKQD